MEMTIFIVLKIKDVGAYCASMSSNYNLHGKPAEIIVEQKMHNGIVVNGYIVSRRQDDIDDILKSYTFA